MTDDVKKLEIDMQALKNELEAQKKITKNAVKCSVCVGIASFFFVVLNFSILFTLSGGIAGNERKVKDLQTQVENLKIKYKEMLLNNN